MVKLGFIHLGQKVDLCIPTGNFGNILSAIHAKKMDVPYNQIISASNENKVLLSRENFDWSSAILRKLRTESDFYDVCCL